MNGSDENAIVVNWEPSEIIHGYYVVIFLAHENALGLVGRTEAWNMVYPLILNGGRQEERRGYAGKLRR